MKKLQSAIIITLTILLSSCATIINGTRQAINITSNPPSATVYINEVDVGITPLSIDLKRKETYDVLIKLDGYQPYKTIISREFNAWYLGNILFGGLIGMIIDPITGAVYKLTPKELNANLKSNSTAFSSSKGKNIYLAVSLEVDPTWEKIGQLEKAQ